MIKNSRVAIIIVNWKKYNMTAKCIESVINSNYPNYFNLMKNYTELVTWGDCLLMAILNI